MIQLFQVQVPFNSHTARQEECVSAPMKIALTFTAPSCAMQNIKTTDPADGTKCGSAGHFKSTDEGTNAVALC